MDFFGKKRIAELEKQVELLISQVASLNSDIRELERENYELLAKYEPSKGPAIVRIATNSFMQSVGGNKNQFTEFTNQTKSLSSSASPGVKCESNEGLITGLIAGAVVAYASSDECYENQSD